MADVTGPISTLPGSQRAAPSGAMCDMHPDRPAVTRIQGETDSFGSEMHDCCQECADEIAQARNSVEARTGCCDWCKRDATDLRDRRDWEEGSCGRVYRVCGACVKEENERLAAEFAEEYDDHFDDYDDDYDDEYDEAEMNCSMMSDGQCGQAGSEYCEMECPFRDEPH